MSIWIYNSKTDIEIINNKIEVIDNEIEIVDGLHDAPLADSTDNSYIRDIVGNKNDTNTGNSLLARIKDIDETVRKDFTHERWFGKSGDQSGYKLDG